MILMFCTAANGGMRSVVEGYRRSGLFEEQDIRWIVTHDSGSLRGRLGLALRAVGQSLRLLSSGKVTGAHLHTAMRGSFWRKSMFGWLSRRFGAKVVYHLHGSEMKPFVDSLPPWARRRLVRTLEGADAVVVLSQSWLDYVRSIAPRANVRTIPNYVDPAPAGSAAPAPAPRAALRVLFLGALGQRKGIYDLLPAVQAVVRQGVPIELVVGGDGEMAQSRQLCTELGLDEHVRFVGWISGERKLEELASADVYVLPSYNEGLPMSILEAMAHGLPVVSTGVGGIPEAVLDGRTGLLVTPGDRDALAAALVALARDPQRRLLMGQAGRERFERAFSPDAVLPLIRQLYADVGMR